MATLKHPHVEEHPLIATSVIVTLAMLVVLFDGAVAIPILGLRGAIYANIAAALITGILAVAFSHEAKQP